MALVMPKSLIFFFWPGEGGIDPNHKMLRTLFGCGKHPVFVPFQKSPSYFMFCLGILIITRGVFWGSSATYSFCYVNLLFDRQQACWPGTTVCMGSARLSVESPAVQWETVQWEEGPGPHTSLFQQPSQGSYNLNAYVSWVLKLLLLCMGRDVQYHTCKCIMVPEYFGSD